MLVVTELVVRGTKRKYKQNKKVLLRELKRHTERGLSSTPYAALSGGGYLPWLGGTYPGRGVPTLPGGYLPCPEGTYLGQGGTSLGWGVPTLAGYSPPPPGCGQTENMTSRLVLRTLSVIDAFIIICSLQAGARCWFCMKKSAEMQAICLATKKDSANRCSEFVDLRTDRVIVCNTWSFTAKPAERSTLKVGYRAGCCAALYETQPVQLWAIRWCSIW